jgi:pimeloyl-ACP methyl ester carboxylesterase
VTAPGEPALLQADEPAGRHPEFHERMIATAKGLYVRDYPPVEPETGLPVFCLPGLTRNSRDFEIVAPRIAALGRRTLAWDTRGRGRSGRDPDAEHYNPSVYAQDAARVLDDLGIERAVFLGTSLGGIVTMALASVAPQRIAAAILNDVGPQLEQAGLTRIGGFVGKTAPVRTWEEAAAACRSIHSRSFPDASESFWLTFARRTFRENADGSIETDYDPAIALAFSEPPAAPPDMTPLFQALASVPVLVVHGEASDLLSSAGVAAMRAVKQDLDVVEVSRIGHAPTLEETDAWEAIIDFLARVP